jgi:hypothetical protein
MTCAEKQKDVCTSASPNKNLQSSSAPTTTTTKEEDTKE